MRMKPPKMSSEEITWLITDALLDSFDVDWTPDQGARAVVRALMSEGLLRVDNVPDAAMNAMLDEVFVAALRRAGV